MKTAVTYSYTFTPSAKTVDLSSISGFDVKKLYAIINTTANQVIFANGQPTYGLASISGSVLTLVYDTTAMSSSDKLTIIYDDPSAGQLVSGAAPVGSAPTLNPVSVSGVDGGGLKRHLLTDTAGRLQVDTVQSLPLPSGASTSANQATSNSLLATIATNTGAQATDFTTTGSISALNGTVSITGQGVYTLSVSVSGTWVGTLVVEGQTPDSIWTALPFYQVSTSTPYPSLKNTTTNGVYVVTGGGYLNMRIRANAWTSGTASIALDGSLSQQTIYAAQLGNVGNTRNKFREEGISYTAGSNWNEVAKSNGALIIADGNTAGSSYLSLSLDPTNASSAITIEAPVSSSLPLELIAGVSMSQRTIGQEFAIELVDTGTATTYSDLTISSIQQATTILTVNTSTAHNLRVGDQISIYGVSDSRVNYSAVVVATVPTTTQFTVTAGPQGAITSITAGPFTSGFVSRRNILGGNSNGIGLVFDNSTVTNAAFFAKAGETNVLPSGTIAAQQEIIVNSTASVQAVNAAYSYAFQPTTEYHLNLEPSRIQLLDQGVDAFTGLNSRVFRTQTTPSTDLTYKLRFRAQNLKGMTMPVAQIVSATKTGTTTATIVTATAHGLTTADLVNIYGLRDQPAYANLTTATAVASVIDSVTFTVVIGTAVTSVTYGGYVARVNGNFNMSLLGAVAQVAQTATLTSGILTLVGNATWAGILIGDYVNLSSIRESTTSGASLGVDGAYRVRNIATTTLELERIDGGSMPADFTVTNCGGAVIKRTDLRMHFAKLFDFDRQRIELLPRAATDISQAMPVNVSNTPAVTISSGTVTTVSTVSTVTAVTAVASVTSDQIAIPGLIADVASAAIITTITTAAIVPTFGSSYSVTVPVTAVSGTSPTLDIGIEESDDTGTNWVRVYDFPRITATGYYRSPVFPFTGNRIRYVQTISGTTPSFTRAINRLQSSLTSNTPFRQIIDRSIVLTTLNSTSPSLTVSGASRVQLVLNVGAITTTAPAIQVEGSDDNGTTWYSIGTPLTAVASSTVQATNLNITSQLVRARVSTAGVGVTAGYVLLRAF